MRISNGGCRVLFRFCKCFGSRSCLPGRGTGKKWKLLLLNQFHDILPGSAIRDVYSDSQNQYEEILSSGRSLAKKARTAALAALEKKSDGESLAVFNPLGFERTGIGILSGREAEKIGWIEDGLKTERLLFQKMQGGDYL